MLARVQTSATVTLGSMSSMIATSPNRVSRSMISTELSVFLAIETATFVVIVVLPMPPFAPKTVTTVPADPFLRFETAVADAESPISTPFITSSIAASSSPVFSGCASRSFAPACMTCRTTESSVLLE